MIYIIAPLLGYRVWGIGFGSFIMIRTNIEIFLEFVKVFLKNTLSRKLKTEIIRLCRE